MTHELDVMRVRGDVSVSVGRNPARGVVNAVLIGAVALGWMGFVYLCLVEASVPYGRSLLAK